MSSSRIVHRSRYDGYAEPKGSVIDYLTGIEKLVDRTAVSCQDHVRIVVAHVEGRFWHHVGIRVITCPCQADVM